MGHLHNQNGTAKQKKGGLYRPPIIDEMKHNVFTGNCKAANQ